jgi:tetratricopeptide (TPR) repeat protein
MKYLFALVFGAGALAGIAFYLNRPGHFAAKEGGPQTQSTMATILEGTEQPRTERGPSPQPEPAQPVSGGSGSKLNSSVPSAAANVGMDAGAISRAVDLLVSPHVSHEQKQAAWRQLKENGALDQAISELEQRTSNNRSSADCAAALGQAYLQKCGAISDVREQGILAMQADKVFDAALDLDSSNWEARFTKAVALSYWPASMGKSDEVINHFLTLIQQQETQPQQPQFAESYLWLGDQYQKAARSDDARNAWGRGAALFPENQQLKNRLASAP